MYKSDENEYYVEQDEDWVRDTIVLHVRVYDEKFGRMIHFIEYIINLYPQQTCELLRVETFFRSRCGWDYLWVRFAAEMCVNTGFPKYGRNIPWINHILDDCHTVRCHHVRDIIVQYSYQPECLLCSEPFSLPRGTKLISFESFVHTGDMPYEMLVTPFK